MTKVTPHFSWEEVSQTDAGLRLGLDNTPPPTLKDNIVYTAENLEVVRDRLGYAIYISSWFRSHRVNAAVGGQANSQHLLGEAVDFVCPSFGSPLTICLALRELKDTIKFDQLIYEYRWVHISWTRRYPPRLEVLTIRPGGGRWLGLPGDSQ